MRPAQIIPELPIGHPRLTPRGVGSNGFPRDIEASVLANKMRVRRRWLIRTGATLLGTAIALCFVVIWERDQMNRAGALHLAEPACAALQAKIDALHGLPVEMPDLAKRYQVSDSTRFYAAQNPGPVIVAAFGQTHLILARDGLCVLIYEGGQVRPQWLTLTEYWARWKDQEHRTKTFETERRSRLPDLP